MAGIILNKDRKVYTYGQPMTSLHLITEGKVRADYPGGSFLLGKGDVIGICEICSEVHFLEYTVTETATILTYPVTNIEALEDFMQKHPDISRFFLLSAFHQIGKLQNSYSLSHVRCGNLYQNLLSDYSAYNKLCERYRLPARPMDELSAYTAYLEDEIPDLWLNEFYAGFSRLYAGPAQKALMQESSASLGMLRKCSLDFRKTYLGAEEQYHYLQGLRHFYFDPSGNDLFDRYTSLYYKMGAACEDMPPVLDAIERMIRDFAADCDCEDPATARRILSFRQEAKHIANRTVSPAQSDGSGSALPSELLGSLNTILDYAGSELDVTDSFRKHVQTYRALTDKTAMDAETSSLRKSVTEEFYILYSLIFERSLSSGFLPAPVRMFLYFGYVDEDLAGHENTVFLYSLLNQITSHKDCGVYTFYDWLLAIFNGEKMPSRNEFDQDYSDYIHKQKVSGSITDSELRQLEDNAMAKVNFELKNLFPLVNKITFGHVTTFCPVFSSDNVLKNLKDTYVTVGKISSALEQIRAVDYTAFYRESLDLDHLDIMGKEPVHTEYLPDVILMPNVGIRGSMWQEIEGRIRNSPGRMFLSIFHMEDVTTTLIRLTGEFRWELCKRIQGGRWNDISDPSLTSEYYDYIQFYRKNHDLTPEAKERLRTSLQRAKNSFREMFVRDYMIWVLFEGKGSPRLNKVSRKILFTYCPFPQKICRSLQDNPLYTELLERHRIKTAQKLHHLDALEQKILRSKSPVPESLTRERRYLTSASS